MLDKNLTLSAIGLRLGVTRQAVHGFCRRHGLTKRADFTAERALRRRTRWMAKLDPTVARVVHAFLRRGFVVEPIRPAYDAPTSRFRADDLHILVRRHAHIQQAGRTRYITFARLDRSADVTVHATPVGCWLIPREARLRAARRIAVRMDGRDAWGRFREAWWPSAAEEAERRPRRASGGRR